jgi:hypothetical protein
MRQQLSFDFKPKHGARAMTQQYQALTTLRMAAMSPQMGLEHLMPAMLRAFFDQKEYSINAMRLYEKNSMATTAMSELLFRKMFPETSCQLILKQSYNTENNIFGYADYDTDASTMKEIDSTVTYSNGFGNNAENFQGHGASGFAQLKASIVNNAQVQQVPIAVVGEGAAGILVVAALRIIGFKNVHLYEKRAALGIWSHETVYKGTKNNPRRINFNTHSALNPARGDGTKDGTDVKEFLNGIRAAFNPNNRNDEEPVNSITPDATGNFNHKLTTKELGEEEFPIIINCIGTGTPREFHDPDRMKLLSASDRPVAVRWQDPRLSPKDLRGKAIAIIGLGNSAAEMMSQLNDFRRDGVDCDYKIFTHFPEDAVYDPHAVVTDKEKQFRVYRDLSIPDLTGFQGDLHKSNADYRQALYEGRIEAGVTGWGVKEGRLVFKQEGTSYNNEYEFNKLYVLTGYQIKPEVFAKFGVPVSRVGHPTYHHDGEFVDGNDDILKGYFGFGAVLDRPEARNTTVIPGMMFRLPDLLFGVIMRAMEYQERQESVQ